MRSWFVQDWPDVYSTYQTYCSYKGYVIKQLSERCRASREGSRMNRSAQVPYHVITNGLGGVMHMLRAELDWAALLNISSWCRFRLGLIICRAVNGRESAAWHQQCIFCLAPVRNATKHVVALFPCFAKTRVAFVSKACLIGANADMLTLAFLQCSPSHANFSAAAQLANEIDVATTHFWRNAQTT